MTNHDTAPVRVTRPLLVMMLSSRPARLDHAPLTGARARLCAMFLIIASSLGISGQAAEGAAYDGWSEVLRLHSQSPDIEALVVPVVGGRLMRYALDGENILYEHAEAAGKTLAAVGQWFMIGGYQCDIGPDSSGIPAHLGLWLGPYHVREVANESVSLESDATECDLQMDKRFVLDPGTGDLTVIQGMSNRSPHTLPPYCLWDRTLCRSGGFVMMPIEPSSRFRKGWAVIERDAAGHMHFIDDREAVGQAKVIGSTLIVHAHGAGFKCGVDSTPGWIAYVSQHLVLIKCFPVSATSHYDEGGCTVTSYVDDHVAELEPLSACVALDHNQRQEFIVHWHLSRIEHAPTTMEEAAMLRPLIDQLAARMGGQRGNALLRSR